MGKYHSYAARLDGIAKAAFERYRTAETALKLAEKQAKEYPPQHGFADAQRVAKAARAQADLAEAREVLNSAKEEMESRKAELRALRSDLAKEIESAYSANPAQLDAATLELLKSGILTAREYEALLQQAQEAGNATMVRLIGKYAGDAGQAAGDKRGAHDPEAALLRVVAAKSRKYTGSEHLEAFDAMLEIYDRCANNPHMIDHWERFTAETVANF